MSLCIVGLTKIAGLTKLFVHILFRSEWGIINQDSMIMIYLWRITSECLQGRKSFYPNDVFSAVIIQCVRWKLFPWLWLEAKNLPTLYLHATFQKIAHSCFCLHVIINVMIWYTLCNNIAAKSLKLSKVFSSIFFVG